MVNSLGEGAARRVAGQLATLGTNVLTVNPGQQFMGRVDPGDNKLMAKGAEAIMDGARYVKAVSPEMSRRLQVDAGTTNAVISRIVSLSGGALLANLVSVTLLLAETISIRR